jgi:transcriptional regulator with XRE-family HTH domain
MELAFPANLRKIRAVRQLTQEQLGELLGCTRSSIGSYEEGRAFPRPEVLLLIVKEFGIIDVVGFISDHAFNERIQTIIHAAPGDSLLQRKYNLLKGKEKDAVDVLLGLKKFS